MFSAMDALLRFQDALERAMENDWFGRETTQRGVFPPMNFFEKDGEFQAVVELPGLKKEDLELEIVRNQVRIAGHRELKYGEDVSLHRMERRPVRFDRTIRLPFAVDVEKAEAKLENGLLALRLPRHPSEAARKISIR